MKSALPGRLAGLAALTLVTVAAVAAQSRPPGAGYDPSPLPETRGTVQRFLLTPRGDIDGLLLTDGTEVKVPPRMTAGIAYTIRPNDEVTVRGLRADAIRLVDAASITHVASGRVLVADAGRPGPRAGTTESVSGRVARSLHNPHGEVDGVLLDDGTALRLPPHEARRLEDRLQPGQVLTAQGRLLDTPLGRVLDVAALADADGRGLEFLGPRADKRPPPPPPGLGPAGPGRGPGPAGR